MVAVGADSGRIVGYRLVRWGARRCGYARMTAQASGNSRYFFERLGFRCVLEQAHNDVLRQRSIESFIAYLERPL
jgi:hypothetical protein